MEIGACAKQIISYAPDIPPYDAEARNKTRKDIELCAQEVLFLIGNSKFCRFVVSHAPLTAIGFMEQAVLQKKYNLPLSTFAQNVAAEAIRNSDSPLYHEGSDYRVGNKKYIEPFSHAIFGSFQLVEGLSRNGGSPLDLWSLKSDLSAEQLEAFKRVFLITYENYIDTKAYNGNAYSINRALDVIKASGSQLYKLNKLENIPYPSAELDKFEVGVKAVSEMITLIESKSGVNFIKSHKRENGVIINPNPLDDIARIMFELYFSASSIGSSADSAHWVQHNIFWSPIFSFRKETPIWKTIRSKFFRLIFDEIKEMERFPNFKGAKVLGMCLNVLGVSPPQRKDYRRSVYPLHKVVLDWTQRNYLTVLRANPRVAAACMIGGITFDRRKKRIVKTYALGLNIKPTQAFLNLDES